MPEQKKTLRKIPRIALVVSRFNANVTEGLLKGALSRLSSEGIDEKHTKVFYCPGAFEIPQTAKKICDSGNYDSVVCLGAVIKGETAHFEYISDAVTRGIMDLNLKYRIPVMFGVLTCYSEEQALERSQANEDNKGAEAASAALDMINLLNGIR